MQRPCVGRNEGEAFAIDGEWRTLSRMSPNHLARASALRHHAEPFHLRPATILTANRGSCGIDGRHVAAPRPISAVFYRLCTAGFRHLAKRHIHRNKPAGRASPHNADSAATKFKRYTTCKNLQKSSRQLTHSTVLAYESAAALSGTPSKSDLDTATDIPGLTALREVDRLALLSFTEQRGASKPAVDTSSHVSPAAPLVRLHQKSRIPITKELNSSSCRSRYSLSTLRPSTLSRGTLRLGLRLCLSTLRARSPISTR